MHRIELVPGYHLIGLTHRGAYHEIGGAWGRLMPLVGKAGLMRSNMLAISVFLDDKSRVAEADLRSFAGVTADPSVTPPDGLEAIELLSGKYAATTYTGPYSGLGTAWQNFVHGLVSARVQLRAAPCFEVYVDDMSKVPAEKLRTDIYVAVE